MSKEMKGNKPAFSEQEKQLIRELQGDIPIVSMPFYEIGKRVGVSEGQVMDTIKRWKKEGLIRRFGSVLRHYKAGIATNAMIVWSVPNDRTMEVGPVMASFSQVSHCYERPVLPQWSYNIYTMVHAGSKEECQAIAEKIAEKTGIDDYQMLFSTKEYKKSSMQYLAD
jgi:DNA-binding Lrp family transcriptional regulator